MTLAKILIVEDEIELAEIIGDFLKADNFEVDYSHTGEGIIDQIKQSPPDLVLLDIMLPNADGMDVCRQLREFSEIPIIMVTAKVDEIDRLLGLNIGADDYICKPVLPKEVVARVRAVLRRSGLTSQQKIEETKLMLDQSQYLAQWNGVPLHLTPVEFRLLEKLSKNNRVYARSELMNVIYEDGRYVYDRTIDSHVKNLRKKLSLVTHIKNPIRSVYGVGYRLDI